jgi:hypothetical protein
VAVSQIIVRTVTIKEATAERSASTLRTVNLRRQITDIRHMVPKSYGNTSSLESGHTWASFLSKKKKLFCEQNNEQ